MNESLNQYKVICCERIKLRPFTIDDAKDMYEYASDEQTVKYLTFKKHENIQESIKTINNFFINKDGAYAIELISEEKVIGCIDLRLQEEHNKASFGYVINRNYWSNGYATEALNAILKLSFEKLLLNRVESTHYVGNEGSGRVMQKCGMEKEGVFKKEVIIKDVVFDVVHYAILR